MSAEADDTSWLGTEPPATEKLLAVPALVEEDWLNITDPNAGRTSLPFRDLIDSCMRGTNRVMAHNGKWLAYRPFNREFDKETNPRTRERMAMHEAEGWMKHIGTYDEVQIWEFLPFGINGKPNPYYHEGGKEYIVGTDYFGDVRQAAKLAYDRKWPEYHDFLEGMAIAVKRKFRKDTLTAKVMWDDALNHITVAINQTKGGPTEKEVNEGFVGVRQARGLQTRGATVMTLDSSGLQKVGFDGKR